MKTHGILSIGIAAVLFGGCANVVILEGPQPGDDQTTGPDAGGPSPDGAAASATSTTTASFGGTRLVPAPTYTASVAVGTLLADPSGQIRYVDPNGQVVLALQGAERQGGQSWALVHGVDLSHSTFDEAESWFARQQATGNPLESGTWDTSHWGPADDCGGTSADGGEADAGAEAPCPSFPIASFVTAADDLSKPLRDALIVRNLGAGNVAAYEVITVTFTNP